jgi:spore maturation protein CgeB
VKVLLVSPAFHGYWRSISGALEGRDHRVATHLYDDFSRLSAKVRNKLRYELPSRLGRDGQRRLRQDATAAAVAAVRERRPDVVVVVKGDVLEADFWDLLDERRLPRVVWLYDELRRVSYTDDTLARIGPIASYSALDAQRLAELSVDARHLPLAFDARLPHHPVGQASREVVFVGARYPQREQTLLALREAGVEVRAFGRQWSHHPVDRLRTWDLRRPDVPAGRDLGREDAYRTMAGAAATLNIHGDQDGFTMRTFEACGVGAVQLIDRTDVGDLYEPGVELATYSSPDELLELCHRTVRDERWAASLRGRARERTLAEHTFDARAAVLEEMWRG